MYIDISIDRDCQDLFMSFENIFQMLIDIASMMCPINGKIQSPRY
jgi:hypothetical protein